MRCVCVFFLILSCGLLAADKPNIILVMTDDQGWGQAGYMNHPLLKTPNLDAMAANGLRFNRFYAGAPVCSPTRASVLTGRNNDRTGVFSHLGRNIASAETVALNNLLRSQLSYYQKNKSDAQKLLLIGNKKVDSKIPAENLAAWTQVARTILNLHEFIVRR